MYYECVNNIPEAKLCPDGLLFEDGNPNQEKCDYPFNVACGKREFVRKCQNKVRGGRIFLTSPLKYFF